MVAVSVTIRNPLLTCGFPGTKYVDMVLEEVSSPMPTGASAVGELGSEPGESQPATRE